MKIERLTTTYTGHRIEADQLIDAHRRGGLPAALAQALETATEAGAGAEAELIRLTAARFAAPSTPGRDSRHPH